MSAQDANSTPGFGERKLEEPVTISLAILERDNYAFAASASGGEPYSLGPDSQVQAGEPNGEIARYHWTSDRIYLGTEEDYGLYAPQQYDGSLPACLMVFQDGERCLSPDINAPVVFDNLIHKGEMPVTIGLFVSTGDRGPGNPIYGGAIFPDTLRWLWRGDPR